MPAAPAAPAPAPADGPRPAAPTAPAPPDPARRTPASPATAPLTPPAATAGSHADGLAREHTLLEPLGLRFRAPTNCVMRADGEGRAAQWTLTERAENPRFILKISRLVANTPGANPGQQIDQYIHAMTTRPPEELVDAVFSVRTRREFRIGAADAGLVYATIREADGLAMVRGYFMLQTHPNEFIVMSVLAAEDDFTAVAPLLERCFETVEHVPEEAVAELRRTRLERADSFLAMLDEESLRTALDLAPEEGAAPPPRWYRLGRRLPDGSEQETGYLIVSVIEGAQGAAKPDSNADKWDALEKEPGLLVLLRVRVLLDEEGTTVADTEGRYWVRWDRQREFWTSRTTQRTARTSRTTTQLGVREAPTPLMPRPVLAVADVNPATLDAKPRHMKTPDSGYIALAEALVLPRLLARVGGPGDYAFNWFDPRSDRPALRRDQLSRVDGGYLLLNNATPEAPTTRQRLGQRGELLLQEGDDGSFTQVIEPTQLLDLWRRKGLPTG